VSDPEDWLAAARHTQSGRALNHGVVEDAAYWRRAQQLIATAVAHPDLQVQRGFVLATRDAHGLYEKFGWQRVEAGRFMRIARPYREG